jgi:hypothetical protein
MAVQGGNVDQKAEAQKEFAAIAKRIIDRTDDVLA